MDDVDYSGCQSLEEDDADHSRCLSPEEVAEAIIALDPAQASRIRSAAKLYAHYPLEAEELENEAYLRALSGQRKCPRSIGIDRFLAEVIRSIAHAEANKVEHRRDEVSIHDDSIEDVDAVTPRDPYQDPEEALINNQKCRDTENKILELFNGDEAAQLIVIGMMCGDQGEELRQASGLDETAYKSKRRKIRRALNKVVEKGLEL